MNKYSSETAIEKPYAYKGMGRDYTAGIALDIDRAINKLIDKINAK